MLPFSYALRNLWRRSTRSLITWLGLAATTLLVIAMTAFATGLERATVDSARDDVMVYVGIASELDLVRSVIPRGKAEAAAASAPGVHERDGVRAASVELHVATRSGDRVGLMRGVTPAAHLVHPQVVIVDGREPRSPYELLVGKLAAARMGLDESACAVGQTIHLERRDWKVVGRFVAPGTVFEAEFWARLEDLMFATKREDVSCVALRADDPAQLAAMRAFAARRLDLEIAPFSERELLQQLERGLAPIVALARWMAVLALVAGAFACSNTMFAAVLARTKELGTLRSLGYAPWALVVALLQEALLLALLGGAAGCIFALLLPPISLRYPMGALSLDFSPLVRGVGLAAALGAGALGGLLPALRSVRVPLVDALGGRT
ncbi:MAG: ABC transporter permease [Planctomycetes bacterium]|nr:ABC transporter permease [Planctomycetota bacterium]